ncbi:MAG: heavy metal translocating P-type ATPase metal-binding domain-containing protein [Bacteroidota bacterium]
MTSSTCYHCGDPCGSNPVRYDGRHFCCNGCKTVYEIFQHNGLECYYDLEAAAGTTPKALVGKYDFLDNPELVEKILDFNEGRTQVVQLHIPHMHCSSCIWVLENLSRLNKGIKTSQVDFPKRKVKITFDSSVLNLKEVVLLLAKIGYAPEIALEDYSRSKNKVDRSLIYKLGVAGFSFGNVMLLSFPEYFESQEFWLDQYKPFFRILMFVFSLPVVFYAAQDYFKSALKGLRSRILNIDVPIALGILVLFLRSSTDIFFDLGSGFFDSLTGLVFFLLVGRFFQQKTYAHLSFERDYRSYFPIGVTKLNADGTEENVAIYKIAKGDRLLVRNQEIIPVDGILIKGNAQIDYSFVTGEAIAVSKLSGDKLFAGGRQVGGALEVEALKSVSQSYLTQLWGDTAFSKNKASSFQTLTDAIGKRFTMAVLTIATVATLFWLWYDPSKALNVFTAVLIIACPCAIALAAPFTLGNLLRIFGRHGLYLKDTNTIERLAKIETLVFDKTGTLTSSSGNKLVYEGMELTAEETSLLRTTIRASNHPLSRELYNILIGHQISTLDEFVEETGKGVEGRNGAKAIKVGAAQYVGATADTAVSETAVHISVNEDYKGRYVFKNNYRNGVVPLFKRLFKNYQIMLLSGDNDSEKSKLQRMFPFQFPMFFRQQPTDKLVFIKNAQTQASVLMIGDGLNDAGALAQSDVGIAVSENVNVFSPACDAILDANKLTRLDHFLQLSKKSITVIKASFILSLCYNIVGLYFAVTGQLEPVIAAILMPLSSISIVVFTTTVIRLLSQKLNTVN